METSVTPNWIKSQLRAANKTQAELATFLGFSGPDIVSKMVTGNREIKVHEAREIIRFFEESRPGMFETGNEFSPSKAPKIDMSHIPPAQQGLADLPNAPKNTAQTDVNDLRYAIVGDCVQVAGTYDADGIEDLIEALEFARRSLLKRRERNK